jgi:hypothetical protein
VAIPPIVCGAVVSIVAVTLPLVVTELALNEQAASDIAGGTAQVKATVPVNPVPGVTVMVEVPDWPGAEMLTLVGFAARLKSGTTVTATGDDTGLDW